MKELVSNLILGTRYKFRVAAENRHGISPESQAVTTRMLEEGKRFCDFGPARLLIILAKSKNSEDKEKRKTSASDSDLLNSFYRIETTLPPNKSTVKKYLTFIKTYQEVYKREKDKISSSYAA